jgi:hypothetical protein
MIKHFNSAMGAAAGSTPASKGKGGNAIIWVVGLAAAVFVGYKFIEARNRAVVQQNG